VGDLASGRRAVVRCSRSPIPSPPKLATEPREIRKRESEFRVRPTGRRITAEALGLSPKTVTRELTAVKTCGLFTRNRGGRSPAPKTSPRGWLTDAGRAALGPVTDEWASAVGPEWTLVQGFTAAHEALAVIGREFGVGPVILTRGSAADRNQKAT
jgi:hypothetical protein